MIVVDWATIKAFCTTRAISIQWLDINGTYYLVAIDGGFTLSCTLIKATQIDEVAEFESGLKLTGNVSLTQLDTDGASIVRNKAAKKGWTFCSLPFEFETSRLSDMLFCKDASGTPRSFVTLKAYDSDDVEVTEAGIANANYATIVKTVIDFEPPYDYEIIGGDLRTLTDITTDIRLWLVAAPDIAAPTGSKEMGGGINLRYLAPGNIFSVDGRVTKYATYNANFHTGKIRLIFKYAAGTHENLMTVVQLYKL